MRKNQFIVLSILMVFLLSCTNDLSTSTDLKKMNIKDKVKSIDESIFNASEKFGEIVKGKLINSWKAESKYDFNSNGFLVKESHYYQSGKLSGEEKWIYNEENKLITKDQSKSCGGGILEVYDGINVLIWDVSISKYSCIYNDNGNLKERLFFNSWGKLFEKAIYKYNNKNLLTTIDRYNSEGKRKKRYTFNYHANNKLKEEIVYRSNGKISEKRTYDERGYCISFETYNKNGVSEGKNLFKNDNNGNRVEEKWSDTRETHKYSYDKEGNQISFVRYDSFGNIIYSEYFEYEYDKRGNWIKKINFEGENREVKDVTIRTIKYY